MNLIQFALKNQSEILHLTLQHLYLVSISTAGAALVGIPLGILLTRKPFLKKPIIATANVIQTIPSLALFGFLIPVLGAYGIGEVPALIALFLYALLPVIQNTYTGITGIDPAIREAAVGMGMTPWQILMQVEFPLSLGFILAGVRIATIISIGTATIAAAIGAGGLGVYIFRGLRMNDDLLILSGAIPAALMALSADFLLGFLERSLSLGQSSRKGKAKTAYRLRLWVVGIASMILVLTLSFLWRHPGAVASGKHPIVIGSKDFTEQVILGELLAQAIETQTGLPVLRRFELGGDLCHRALLAHEIDGYVEYTGTAFTAILKHPPISDPKKVYEEVKSEYASRFRVAWLPPLGFNNTFAILIRGDMARRLHVKTITDIVPVAREWQVAFGQDFKSRKDGYPGFIKAYGLHFEKPPNEMDLSLTYRALANGQVDLIAGNSTDGLIAKLNLVQLADDRHYFPPYEAAPLFREDTLKEYPQIKGVIEGLAGKISNEMMRRMNLEVDEGHRSAKDVVKEFLSHVR